MLKELVGLSLASRSGVGLESEILLGPDIGSHTCRSLGGKLFAVKRNAEAGMEGHIRASKLEILFSLVSRGAGLIGRQIDAKKRQKLD